jgi:hypothetical protein
MLQTRPGDRAGFFISPSSRRAHLSAVMASTAKP